MISLSEDIFTDNQGVISEFLCARAQAAGIANPRIHVSSDKMIVVSLKREDDKNVFFMGLDDRGSDYLELGSIFVGEKKKGWGVFGLELAIGVAFARDKSHVVIPETIKDGGGFFSKMGALPKIEKAQKEDYGVKLAETFGVFRMYLENALDASAKKEIERLQRLSKHNPLLAYRGLVQSKTIVSGQSLYRCLADCLPHVPSMILLPGEPTTRVLLQRHVKVVPPFRGVPSRYDFMRKELADAFMLQPAVKPVLNVG